MAKKFYGVKSGYTPGVYNSWDECAKQVKGYPGAEYRGFSTLEDAGKYVFGKDYVKTVKKQPVQNTIDNVDMGSDVLAVLKNAHRAQEQAPAQPSLPDEDMPAVYAYVDGSFNSETGTYGYGGFLSNNGERYYFKGKGDDPDLATMRNIAGELSGSLMAIYKARRLGLKEITIYHDYVGIASWVNGVWKCNKEGVQVYRDAIEAERADGMKINFIKVKGHTGIEGNEIADKLAKEAAGVTATKKTVEPPFEDEDDQLAEDLCLD